MHDHTPDDSGYEWPTCAAGPDEGPRSHQLWSDELDRLVCRPCEDKTAGRIAELPALFRKLDTTAALMRGARQPGGSSSGSRTAPIPLRLEVLALTGSGGVAARLQAIEDSWRQALGWPTPPPTAPRTVYPVWRDKDGARHVGEAVRDDRVYPYWRTDHTAGAVPRCAVFLANNLRWAVERYESVGQDIDTLGRLHGEMKAIVDDERRPGRVQIGNCPVQLDDGPCWTPLTARADSHRVHCPSCNARWEGLGEWRELRAAQEAVLAEAAGVAA